jgi:hypothetical protein
MGARNVAFVRSPFPPKVCSASLDHGDVPIPKVVVTSGKTASLPCVPALQPILLPDRHARKLTIYLGRLGIRCGQEKSYVVVL